MTTWTVDRTELLVELRKQHQPVPVMVDRLGLSRNAIIGKLHRLGLSVARIRKPVPTLTASEPPSEEVLKAGVTLMQLTDKTCRWPLGDVRDPGFIYCGELPLEGCPYCEEHAKIAYNRGGSINVTSKTFSWRK